MLRVAKVYLLSKCCSKDRNLPLDHLSACTTNGLAPFNTGLEVKHSFDIFRELVIEGLEVFESELIELTLS